MAKRDRHHRHPKSRRTSYKGDINENRNVSMVRREDHIHYHALFGNMLPNEMAAMLNDVWVSPDYYLVAVPRYKRTSKRRQRLYCQECECEVLKHIPKKPVDK